ncbi:hypothetical protein [Gimesia sp.]|uniref:hypothetical protein n=1 Tax=Gimesia sp. TaxID=2024833 RepID=UPI0025C0E316|nr:hypothetical protein [Gimesia sp.]
MKRSCTPLLLAVCLLCVTQCPFVLNQTTAAPPEERQAVSSQSVPAQSVKQQAATIRQQKPKATPQQEKQIRALIEQLVFDESIDPKNKKALEKERDLCYDAYSKLFKYKELAFPVLMEHLDDERPSVYFRNHYLEHAVGDACYWNMVYQLQDRPKDYSRYGYARQGRDGKSHPKPVWEGSPFAEAGGLKKWLIANQNLSYTEQQIKCLNWMLAAEKKIGAADAESYFVNILPLEIQILKRRQQLGHDVQAELKRLQQIKAEKLVNQIPAELLPEKQK